jgi:SAM-dependent methyltransferase
MTEAAALGPSSQLGVIYEKAYATLCGRHPYQRPWHFQYLVVLDTHRWLRRHIGDLRGSLLDVGCGDRPYEDWIRRGPEGVTSDIGLDIYDGPGVDIVVEPDRRWPIDDASVDCILCNEVLEHVADRKHVTGEIARVLKPGGLLLVTVPFIYPVHGWPHDYVRFTINGVRQLFEEHYELLELVPLGRAGTSLGTLFLAWIDTSMNSNRATRLLKGLLLPVWIVFSLIVNLVCLAIDALDRTGTHYTQVGLLARRKGLPAR